MLNWPDSAFQLDPDMGLVYTGTVKQVLGYVLFLSFSSAFCVLASTSVAAPRAATPTTAEAPHSPEPPPAANSKDSLSNLLITSVVTAIFGTLTAIIGALVATKGAIWKRTAEDKYEKVKLAEEQRRETLSYLHGQAASLHRSLYELFNRAKDPTIPTERLLLELVPSLSAYSTYANACEATDTSRFNPEQSKALSAILSYSAWCFLLLSSVPETRQDPGRQNEIGHYLDAILEQYQKLIAESAT